MTTEEKIFKAAISKNQDDPTKKSVSAAGRAEPVAAGDEQPMAKPSVIWFLVPIVIIAVAMFLAR